MTLICPKNSVLHPYDHKFSRLHKKTTWDAEKIEVESIELLVCDYCGKVVDPLGAGHKTVSAQKRKRRKKT